MVRIKFTDLNVETLSGSSGIFYGHNQHVKWRNESKTNEAFGDADDGSEVVGNQSILNDADVADILTGDDKGTSR